MPSRSHGLSGTNEYLVWSAIKTRCQNVSSKGYANYGAKGVRLCLRWQTFANFLADMGRRPSKGHSIERTENDGDYEPGNCRWATRLEQANNKRSTIFVEYRGQTMSLNNAARAAGNIVSPKIARARVLRGWTAKDAVETPKVTERLAAETPTQNGSGAA